ncbi:HAMP domain-containing protein [Pseudoduganella eburnea]|uniref:HAMP domain-containing protein n=1 Tax=Massilia eburnea TaxID=1776165 RepID=A0A6L6QD14_9BURK|nr:methyl-accepting chemotaxis protein [Massilia eburnea]MTW10049.1 HAMP domain-containing protein [Massilia eburnea]
MLKNLRIQTKLRLGFGVFVAVLLFLLIVAYQHSVRVYEANRWDKHTLAVILEANRIANDVLEMQATVRGYLLTGESDDLAQLPALELSLRGHLAKAVLLTADNPGRQERFNKIRHLVDDWVKNYLNMLIEQRRGLGHDIRAADQIGRSPLLKGALHLTKEIGTLIDAASDDEARLLAERVQESSRLQAGMFLVLTLGGALCIGLALIVAYWLNGTLQAPLDHLADAVRRMGAGDLAARAVVISDDELAQVTIQFNRMAQVIQDSQAKERAATDLLTSQVNALSAVVARASAGDLTGKVGVSGNDVIGQLGDGLARMVDNLQALIRSVQEACMQVTASATEIGASAKQQETTGIAQAKSSAEIRSTTKEISINTAKLLRTMEDAIIVADYTTSATAVAQNGLQRMDVTMQNMVSATGTITSKLAALSEKSSSINSVLVTITKVADQTNLLSLNAAIEAENAGQAGRGFAVVAGEIRRLADQTAASAWDIEQMLKEMQSAVSASVMGMDKFSEEIRRSVGEVMDVSNQLSGVMDQVQKMVPHFDAVLQGMQSQATGAMQISQTMGQLDDVSQQTLDSLKATSQAIRQLQYAAGTMQSSIANFIVAA